MAIKTTPPAAHQNEADVTLPPKAPKAPPPPAKAKVIGIRLLMPKTMVPNKIPIRSKTELKAENPTASAVINAEAKKAKNAFWGPLKVYLKDWGL